MYREKIQRAFDGVAPRCRSASLKSARCFSFVRGNTKKIVLVGAGVVLILGLLYVAGHTFFRGYYPWASEEARVQAEMESALSQVAKKMLLPSGEPIMATVNDADVLRTQQAFFQNAENGDQLLIFSESAQAVLYSPSRDVIVNVGPVQYGNDIIEASSDRSTAQIPTVEEEQVITDEVSVEVRNGTSITGLAAGTANEVRTLGGITITAVTDAAHDAYSNTAVIVNDTDDQVQQKAVAIAQFLGADITSIPAGEVNSTADVLVIVGG